MSQYRESVDRGWARYWQQLYEKVPLNSPWLPQYFARWQHYEARRLDDQDDIIDIQNSMLIDCGKHPSCRAPPSSSGGYNPELISEGAGGLLEVLTETFYWLPPWVLIFME